MVLCGQLINVCEAYFGSQMKGVIACKVIVLHWWWVMLCDSTKPPTPCKCQGRLKFRTGLRIKLICIKKLVLTGKTKDREKWFPSRMKHPIPDSACYLCLSMFSFFILYHGFLLHSRKFLWFTWSVNFRSHKADKVRAKFSEFKHI